MRALTRARSLLFLTCAFATGCVDPGDQALDDQDPHQPGDALGVYSVTGKLSDDSCGAESLNAPEKWSFQVKLSREGSTLYWLNGREAIVGDIDRSGRFGFETHIDVPLAEKRGAVPGCTMVRRDVASGTLSDSSSTWSAKLSYVYEEKAGSDCSAFAIGTDGLPLALPCKLSYRLDGERLE
jgi:hypothetical protein